jgi:hypothetical protein
LFRVPAHKAKKYSLVNLLGLLSHLSDAKILKMPFNYHYGIILLPRALTFIILLLVLGKEKRKEGRMGKPEECSEMFYYSCAWSMHWKLNSSPNKAGIPLHFLFRPQIAFERA